MSENRHIKKQILRQTVAENVAIREGHRPPRPAPVAKQPPKRRLLPWLALAPLPVLALLLLWWLLPSRQPSPPSSVPVAAPAVETTSGPVDESTATSFPAPAPIDARALPLEVRRVVVDPGHGGHDSGTVTVGGPELLEKDLALDIGLRLRDRLVEAEFDVIMTRGVDRFISLRERAAIANTSRADLFISIHLNWIVTREVRGVETYYLGPTDDPRLVALARRENQDSGYSLADMRSLLDGIYADVRQDESRQLAQRVQRSLLRAMLRHDPDLDDRGVKTAPFVVLTATEMPAILAEVSCLSNREEAERLTRPQYRDSIADALFRGIQSYADAVNSIEEKGS
ncbi:MAG: N-acetylmuramoyl-L-alanine amidase [Acidobacteriota bacterium]